MGPRIYTYKITFPVQGWWYWGAHKEKKPGEFYAGSPKTHKEKWENFYFEVQILEHFDTWEEALEVEKRLIKPDLQNPNCLNEHCGGGLSSEACARGARKVGAQNVASGRLRRAGRLGASAGGKVTGPIQGKINVETGHWKRLQSAAGKIGGKTTSSQKWQCLVTGFISTPGPLTCYQNKRGIDPSLRKRLS